MQVAKHQDPHIIRNIANPDKVVLGELKKLINSPTYSEVALTLISACELERVCIGKITMDFQSSYFILIVFETLTTSLNPNIS